MSSLVSANGYLLHSPGGAALAINCEDDGSPQPGPDCPGACTTGTWPANITVSISGAQRIPAFGTTVSWLYDPNGTFVLSRNTASTVVICNPANLCDFSTQQTFTNTLCHQPSQTLTYCTGYATFAYSGSRSTVVVNMLGYYRQLQIPPAQGCFDSPDTLGATVLSVEVGAHNCLTHTYAQVSVPATASRTAYTLTVVLGP